jgi:hypothetical protein
MLPVIFDHAIIASYLEGSHENLFKKIPGDFSAMRTFRLAYCLHGTADVEGINEYAGNAIFRSQVCYLKFCSSILLPINDG